MRNSTRLIVNTLITYARAAITFAIGLVVVRLVVRQLGFVNYGLLAVLGGTGVFLNTLTASLGKSAQRHLAYEIGRQDHARLRAVFHTTLWIFLAAAIFVCVVGWGLRKPILSVLTIPGDRLWAAQWVYLLVISQMALRVAVTPFTATLQAHQSLVLLAWWDVTGRVLDLCAAISLGYVRWDRLVTYSALTTVLVAAGTISPVVICLWKFPECRLPWGRTNRGLLKEIGGFAGWSMLSQFGWDLRSQGSLLLINIKFGPVINGAYDIGQRLMGYQNQMALTISGAIQPAITTLAGRGERQQVKKLLCLGCKYPVFAAMLVWIPLMVDVEGILQLWLGKYPEYTPVFTRLVTSMMLVSMASSGHQMAAEAMGQIRRLSIWTAVVNVVPVVIAGAMYYGLGSPVWVLPLLVLLFAGGFSVLYRPRHVGAMVDLPAWEWVRTVLVPLTITTLAGLVVTWATHWALPPGRWRTLAEFVVNAMVCMPMIWFVGMERWEKDRFLDVFRSMVRRLRKGTVTAKSRMIDLLSP